MSLRITYWGDGPDTMSWMDVPPCGPESCNGANTGAAVISKIIVKQGASSPGSVDQASTTPAPIAGSQTPTQNAKYSWHGLEVKGMPKAFVAGNPGQAGIGDGAA